jgi:hypothetical protein
MVVVGIAIGIAVTLKAWAGEGCTGNATAWCTSPSTNTIGPCKIVCSGAQYTLCSSGGSSSGCSQPQNYNCVVQLTYSGTFCYVKNGPQTNVVSQTLATGSCQ